MTNTLARLKSKGKNFEIIVNLDLALKLKNGEKINIAEVVEGDRVFSDSKKGLHASEADLQSAFGSSDINIAAEKIIRHGEIQLTQEYRVKERESKIKQIIDFLSRNALNPATNQPHTPERIKQAIEQAGVNIDNSPIEAQVGKIVEKIKGILPVKFETKKLKVTVPAQYTGQVYGVIKEYKEREEWLSNGDLKVVINLPIGLQMEFYDKLNSITHGSSMVEEIKEKKFQGDLR